MLDEHCHIVWDVDDGSRSRSESLEMLNAAYYAGITHIVCTPHFRWDDFDRAKVQRHFADLRVVASSLGIQMTLGYEVYYRRLLKTGIDFAPTFAEQGSNNVLLEFNTGGEVDPNWKQTVHAIQSMGYDVTFAHPERYVSVWDDFDLVYRFKQEGCRVQVSAGDLFGGAFDKQAKHAKQILKEGLCDALVSDAHRVEHYRDYVKALDKYGHLVGTR